LPEAAIEAQVATLPGLDGRKMSKSYDNVIPLFAAREQLKKLIAGIVTDSRAPGEAKDVDTSNVFQLYQAFASDEETAAMREAFFAGIAWGEAKQRLFERIDLEVAPMRDRYEALVAHPERIEAQLRDGAERVRAQYATPLLQQLREAVGLRDLSRVALTAHPREAKATRPVFKQYREGDGRFYFKLADGERLLLQSIGFDAAREAGQLVARLKQEGGAALRDAEAGVHVGEQLVGHLHAGVELAEVAEALARLAEDA
jgi:tryptophanyl-tRNA synthetase